MIYEADFYIHVLQKKWLFVKLKITSFNSQKSSQMKFFTIKITVTITHVKNILLVGIVVRKEKKYYSG